MIKIAKYTTYIVSSEEIHLQSTATIRYRLICLFFSLSRRMLLILIECTGVSIRTLPV